MPGTLPKSFEVAHAFLTHRNVPVMRCGHACGMTDLLSALRDVHQVRACIARAEHQATSGTGRSAADRFADRVRIGTMRHDDARLTARLRTEACGGDPSLGRRFDRLMLLVDEVVMLELEAEVDTADDMRGAMARQAAGELAAEAAALLERVAALPPRPTLRLVDQVG